MVDPVNPSARLSLQGPDDSDSRSDFRRDRDRIFYAGEFARLEGVTQVATISAAGIHNRLTHSYRVEQVARSIASHLNKKSTGLVDEDVVSGAALAHDIGHPPFGHTGELALQELLTCEVHRPGGTRTDFDNRAPVRDNLQAHKQQRCPDCKLIDSFEGNAQTFRVLARLGAKHIDPELGKKVGPIGLDLTRATLAAVSKYPWTKGFNVNKLEKWGAYDCDASALEWVQGVRDANAPDLSAQLMDKADDIAYAVHDIEDFYKSGAIPLWDVRLGRQFMPAFLDYVRAEFESKDLAVGDEPANAHARRGESPLAPLEEEFNRFRQGAQDAGTPETWSGSIDRDKFPVLAFFRSSLRWFPSDRYADDVKGRATVAKWRSRLIKIFVDDLEVDDNGSLDFRHENVRLLIEFLKQLTWYFVIDDPSLEAIREGQRRVVEACFGSYFAQASRIWLDAEHPERFRSYTAHETKSVPPRLLAYIEVGQQQQGAANRYLPREIIARAVVDYICSLTDEQVYILASQLRGEPLHSVPNSLVPAP